jgi:hypothetical protein
MNVVCGRNAELLIVKAGGTCSYHGAMKSAGLFRVIEMTEKEDKMLYFRNNDHMMQ